jgi:hypothetical protein
VHNKQLPLISVQVLRLCKERGGGGVSGRIRMGVER